ncbi:MAG: VWA domain-containing protein [Oscillospiraceae bacterium]|nr:VWA domain-containing protein [Oscillospiraceae bacterium]
MGITKSTKELSTDRIPCGGSFTVTLALTAEPDIVSNPTDIVLILDRSGSMAQSLPSLKSAAKLFIDIIDESTDGTQDGQIGGGSRIGIVSFATTANQDTQLITSVSALKDAVNALVSGGATNHEDAFTKALAMFNPASGNAKVMVMFTDGETTAGGPPNPVATAAKAQGVTIYVIGLVGNGGIDEQALRDWASDPDSAYVAIAPSDEELEKLFEDLARNISKPGSTDIVIDEKVTECFRILSLSTPAKGTAVITGDRTLQWKIAELGKTQSEGAELTFTVEHNGICSGTLPVNESIDYDDTEGNDVDFGDPAIEVDCGTDVMPEPCPKPVDIRIDGCDDAVVFDAGDVKLESLGRILQLDVSLKNVCPNKRVALAVILTEVDDKGHEFKRGLKTLVIPAHHQSGCRDVNVRCIKFVLPEELDVSGRNDAICNRRNFKARFIAHYIDTDFECCHL